MECSHGLSVPLDFGFDVVPAAVLGQVNLMVQALLQVIPEYVVLGDALVAVGVGLEGFDFSVGQFDKHGLDELRKLVVVGLEFALAFIVSLDPVVVELFGSAASSADGLLGRDGGGGGTGLLVCSTLSTPASTFTFRRRLWSGCRGAGCRFLCGILGDILRIRHDGGRSDTCRNECRRLRKGIQIWREKDEWGGRRK